MSDLISRQKAIQKIKELPNSPNGFSATYDKASIIMAIKDVEPVEPVTHAHWQWDENALEWDENALDWNIGAWVCSECGMNYADTDVATRHDIDVNVWACSNFCGHCGAKMDGDPDA